MFSNNQSSQSQLAKIGLTLSLSLGLGACGFKAELKETAPKPTASGGLPDNSPSNSPRRPVKLIPVMTRKILETHLQELKQNLKVGQVVFGGMLADLKPEDPASEQILPENNPELIETRALTEKELELLRNVGQEKTYINVGCGKLAPAMITGLQVTKPIKVLATSTIHFIAQKIFVCGNGSVTLANTIVVADELHLKNTQQNFLNSKGGVFVLANQLHLEGISVFKSVESKEQINNPGSPILFNVESKIVGQGRLFINRQP
jgi:hypothetical protein